MISLKHTFSRRELLWFGPLFAAFAGLIAVLAWWKFEAPQVAKWSGIFAASTIVVYYLAPPLRRPIYIAWLGAVFPVGWIISHILLGIVFYLVVFPIGMLLRLFRYDALQRRFSPASRSYWIERDPRKDPATYFRQH
tara:strand:+ start:233 stop:643 length:411 start_codon:yes stop_codon:yes gene_type:complete